MITTQKKLIALRALKLTVQRLIGPFGKVIAPPDDENATMLERAYGLFLYEIHHEILVLMKEAEKENGNPANSESAQYR